MKVKRLTAAAVAAMMLASGAAFAEDEKVSGTTGSVLTETKTVENIAAENSDGAITVTVDGKVLTFDQEPIMENDRVLVPFRAIFEALGCSVDYYENGGVETVYAKMGSKSISLTIGSTEIYASGEQKTIDVAPKIVNDRTLVPIRVASESFGANVEWNGELNIVEITSEQGFYKINRMKNTYDERAEDGTVIYIIDCYYPEFENSDNNEFITSINEDVLNARNSYINTINEEYRKMANEEYEYLKENPDEREFMPYEFEFDYDIDYNTEDFLTITAVLYFDLHGAHPTTSMTSVTYDMKAKKELALTDIWDMDETAATNEVIFAFNEDIDKNPDMYFEDAKDTLEKIAKDVEFYMDGEGVHLYFQLYDIAPYAAGYPEVLVPFEGNEQMYKIKIAK